LKYGDYLKSLNFPEIKKKTAKLKTREIFQNLLFRYFSKLQSAKYKMMYKKGRRTDQIMKIF